MIGAIAGDIIGLVHETRQIKTKDFPLFGRFSRFTDDIVLTVAVADCLINQKDYVETLQKYGRKYPKKKYGSRFYNWFSNENPTPYNSFGNGSAMRLSSIGFFFNTIEEVLFHAGKSASITQNLPEGIKGAQAVAVTVLLAKNSKTKCEIKTFITETFGYNLNKTLAEIRETYQFDVTCQGSVPESIISFLESDNYEDAIRNAISLGGESDTMPCIAGGIAQSFYKKIPNEIITETRKRLNEEFLEIIDIFEQKTDCKY
jgi:ADP-ribosylglycohydrolase